MQPYKAIIINKTQLFFLTEEYIIGVVYFIADTRTQDIIHVLKKYEGKIQTLGRYFFYRLAIKIARAFAATDYWANLPFDFWSGF